MDAKRARHISKFLSLVLRHKPYLIGIQLDAAGWVSVDELLEAMRRHGRRVTRSELEYVVRTNEKRRFALSDDRTRIRASQGHSIPVDLGYEPVEPPELLYHGTARRFLPSILSDGLLPAGRHHVHLHADRQVAKAVGRRHGKPVILVVQAKRMFDEGYRFFCTPNNVWLTDHVPPEYLGVHG